MILGWGIVKKGILVVAALSVLVILPNWLRNEPYSAYLVQNILAICTDASVVPVSETGVSLVFDLSGVLLDIDTKKALDEMGPFNILNYITQLKISPFAVKRELLKKVYEILNAVQKEGNDCQARDPYGNCMPGIMCEWQSGRKGNAECAALIADRIQQHPEWFASAIEKKLVELVIDKMFIPELLVSTIILVPEGLEYVKKCKNQGHRLFVLSNWDAESFELLLKKFPELFIHFDGIVTSGALKCMKPQPEAYALFVDRKNRYNETVIFIDDQKENTDAASGVGIQGIHYTKKTGFLGFSSNANFEYIEQQVTSFLKENALHKKALKK